jgi:hypothetical protein
MAVRKTSVRSGSVNHRRDGEAHALHRLVVETAPFYLDITPLDVDHVEVLFGFDLMAGGNHDGIIFSALLAGSPLASLCDRPGLSPIDCQPIFGISLGDEPAPVGAGEISAYVEVKTRTAGGGGGRGPGGRGKSRSHSAQESRSDDFLEHPISLYLILRKPGPISDIRELPGLYNTLVAHGEELLERRVVPKLLTPIREAIAAA